MRKLWRSLTVLAVLAMLLTSCAGGTASGVPTEKAASPEPTTVPALPTAALPTSAVVLPTEAASGSALCTVESSLFKQEPPDSKRFAPVTEKDWILGSPDAKITLLEYSDFM